MRPAMASLSRLSSVVRPDEVSDTILGVSATVHVILAVRTELHARAGRGASSTHVHNIITMD